MDHPHVPKIQLHAFDRRAKRRILKVYERALSVSKRAIAISVLECADHDETPHWDNITIEWLSGELPTAEIVCWGFTLDEAVEFATRSAHHRDTHTRLTTRIDGVETEIQLSKLPTAYAQASELERKLMLERGV